MKCEVGFPSLSPSPTPVMVWVSVVGFPLLRRLLYMVELGLAVSVGQLRKHCPLWSLGLKLLASRGIPLAPDNLCLIDILSW